ncbi:hypothetical protein [Aequorivita marina]|uniref:hypothetical protein n=1 Tax=Aequorivita marina TaxID=3073654 RepID=UPI0028752089|nr:hypothetical protein [Aequorivita sp. S2608]MDS1297740.1 hypothetical protein [Aequorivita sp. S2608]
MAFTTKTASKAGKKSTRAGVPNKTTQQMKDVMGAFIESKIDDLETIFEQLEPNDKINAIIKMLPYLMPKQSQMKMEATHKQEAQQLDYSKLSDDELHFIVGIYDKQKV